MTSEILSSHPPPATLSDVTKYSENLSFGYVIDGLLDSDSKDQDVSLSDISFGTSTILRDTESPHLNDSYSHTSLNEFSSDLPDNAPLNLDATLTNPSSWPLIDPTDVPIQATSFDGKRVYFARRCKPKTFRKTHTETNRSTTLLEVPLHRLMNEISETSRRKITTTSGNNITPQASSSRLSDSLWVDRYKPKRFTDLLGDERVHRETMAWVKEWDHCVFRKQKAKRRKRSRDEDENFGPEDPYHRPLEKILLLSGPPGLGKTTLASVIARQAGYDVLEINASDSRTGNIIDDRIRPALEAGSMIGTKKPTLVIIDEIDGATGAGENMGSFIQKLLELTFDRTKRKTKTKGNNDGKRPLLRPIICICNDLYASSLARLRPICKIVRFQRAADILVAKRLREICSIEGLKIDAHAVGLLTRVGQGDIRACVNALQFLNARIQQSDTSEISEPILRAAIAGMKESESSFTSALNDLFSPPTKKRAKELGLSELEEIDHSARFIDRLSRVIESTGSPEKVAIGCFEHYCSLHLHDLSKFDKAQRWLGAFDMFSGAIHAEREYAIMPYLSHCLIPFYTLFSQRGGSLVERPKADWENYQNMKTHEEIYKSLSKCLHSPSKPMPALFGEGPSESGSSPVDLRHLLATPVLQLEFAPLLNRIITPPLRPVNKQIVRTGERVVLRNLVNIMTALELRFVLDKNEEGQPVYRLEPPIEAFVTYDGKRAADIPPPRFATRQLIATEIDEALERRKNEAVEKSKGKASTSSPFKHSEREEEQPTLKRQKISGDKPAKIDIADKPPTDFFGRPLVPVAPKKSVLPDMMNIDQTPELPLKRFKVTYRFNEGNSAAVRRPLKVSAML